jgi:hypothetical protein
MPLNNTETSSKKQPDFQRLTPEGLAKHTRTCALAIAEQGGRVFPMRFIKDASTGKISKVPALKGWPEKATVDPEQIKRRFARLGLGIGIATEASGWVVFDTDQKPGVDGDAHLRALLGDHAHYLDETETVLTPTGSRHYRFTGEPVKSTAGVLAPGVDVKSRGGYVVGEGTISDKGVYRVIANRGTRLPLPQPIIDIVAREYAAKGGGDAERRKLAPGVDVPGDDPSDIELGRDYLRNRNDDEIDGYTNAMAIGRRLGDFGILPDTAAQLFDDEINPRLPRGREWEMDELVKKMNDWGNGRENAFGSDSYAAAAHDFDDLDAERDAELELCQELGLAVPAMIRAAAANAKARDNGEPAGRISATPFVWIDPATIPKRQWLFRKHYIRGYATGTVAPGGTGKTAMTIVEALSMATGRDLIGGDPNPVGLKVWLWNLEDPEVEIRRRIAAAVQHHHIVPATLDGKLFVNSGRDTPLVIARKVKDTIKVLEPVVDALVAEIRAKGIDVLIVDPFVSSHSLPENDNAAMDAAVKAWARVAHLGNCAVELVHHSRKLGGEEASAESARGGSAFVDACRGVRVINRMSTEEAGKLGISEPRYFFSMVDDKPNMAPPPTSKRDWFQLVSVPLPNGDDVGSVDRWQKPNQLDDVTPEHLARVQALFTEGNYLVNEQSPEWGGRAVASVIGVEIGIGLPAKERTAEQNSSRAKVRAVLAMWLKTPGGIKIEQRKNAKREIKDCYAASDDAV